jgi:hypothetical protein
MEVQYRTKYCKPTKKKLAIFPLFSVRESLVSDIQTFFYSVSCQAPWILVAAFVSGIKTSYNWYLYIKKYAVMYVHVRFADGDKTFVPVCEM